MSQRQINIRLPDEEVAVLEAAAFLEGGSLADLVRTALTDRVAGLRTDPRVLDALRLRAERSAEKAGVLRPLDAKRRGGQNGHAS